MCEKCVIVDREKGKLVVLLTKWEKDLAHNDVYAPFLSSSDPKKLYDAYESKLLQFDKDTNDLIKKYSEIMARAERISKFKVKVQKIESKFLISQNQILNIRQDLKRRDFKGYMVFAPKLYKRFLELINSCIQFLEAAVDLEHNGTSVLHLFVI
ncbi:MAG: hypothetical protein Q8R18_06260 [bacterium]|nr:hypothetical protein [bacterium]